MGQRSNVIGGSHPEPRVMTSLASEAESLAYAEQVSLLKKCPIPDEEILANLRLFLNRSALSRILYFHNLYSRILEVSGVVMEFGVRWGADLALLATLRSIYEPFNFSRKIVGFDTFRGFPSVSPKDGKNDIVQIGALSVTEGYEQYLDKLLATHERLAPRANIKKYELVKGDVCSTLPAYLESHSETVVALAYFDLDLYDPTLCCLKALEGRVTKGTIVAFDELCLDVFPGETRALRDFGWLGKYRLQRLPIMGFESFIVIE